MLMHKYIELKQLVEALEPDITKFINKGTYLAGTRTRNQLRNIKLHCDDVRNIIQITRKLNLKKKNNID